MNHFTPLRVAARTGPRVVALEARDVPAAYALSQSFDALAAGVAPAGWDTASVVGNAGFTVQPGPATSATQALVAAPSTTSIVALAAPQAVSGPLEVAANTLRATNDPISVFAYGSNLGTGSFTFVAARMNGDLLNLYRATNGRYQTLANVTIPGVPGTGEWVRVRLTADAGGVQVGVQNVRTGLWYAGGKWQAAQGAALTYSDASLPTDGLAGVLRRNTSTEAVRVDDVVVRGSYTDTAAPTVAITSPLAGAVGGTVTLQAAAADNDGVERVAWYVDGTIVGGSTASPYATPLTTTTLADGVHTLVARAFDRSGNSADAARTFTVSNADGVAPTVAITGPTGGTINGSVVVAADASDDRGVGRVEFWLDGTLRQTDAAAPYTWTLDATQLAAGPHTLVVRAFDAAGNVGTDTKTLTAVATPAGQHYSHIRVAMLAYYGTPFTTVETGLLQTSVDLVVSNPAYLAQIDAVAPNTPQYVYTNVSNLYGSLLTDWLNYSERYGLDREQAFYHAATATPFTGSSPSSQPVTWFWNVRSETADLTYAARSAAADLTFGAAGTAVYVSSVDRFREINVALARGAAAGWAGVWEYASGVDAAGNVTAWSPLTPLGDTSGGLAQGGRVTFDPPADWKAGSLAGGDRLFSVRFRTTADGTAPIATTILGRDYVSAVTGGGGAVSGVVPAFDKAADANNDGYLTDAEYANHAAGKDARFTSESRVLYPNYGQMRFATNPAAASVRGWANDYHARLFATTPQADGIFVDNATSKTPLAGIVTVENASNYTADAAGLLNALTQSIGPKQLLANTSGGGGFGTAVNTVAANVPATFEEFGLRALAHSWAAFNDINQGVAYRLGLAGGTKSVVLDSYPQNTTATDPRYQIGTLAYYYQMADPQRTYLLVNGGYEPATSWTRHWIPAAAVDVGQPVGPSRLRFSGADPANPALEYRVFGREYTNALVLYKPLSYRQNTGTGTAADGTATTHALGGNYRALNADGSLGPVVTSVTLRNGEGAVLMKA